MLGCSRQVPRRKTGRFGLVASNQSCCPLNSHHSVYNEKIFRMQNALLHNHVEEEYIAYVYVCVYI